MAKVKVKERKVKASYQVTLSEKEARAVFALLNSIGGLSKTRSMLTKETGNLYEALLDAIGADYVLEPYHSVNLDVNTKVVVNQ